MEIKFDKQICSITPTSAFGIEYRVGSLSREASPRKGNILLPLGKSSTSKRIGAELNVGGAARAELIPRQFGINFK